MIYVECKPDATLVRILTDLPLREVIHELKGKSGVMSRLSQQRSCKGMIDEDPQSTQPGSLRALTVLQDLPDRGLRLLQDTARDNHVVVLCPRLEDWILRVSHSAGVDVERHYGLPDDPRRLHRVINDDLRRFERLVQDLRTSEGLAPLRDLLSR